MSKLQFNGVAVTVDDKGAFNAKTSAGNVRAFSYSALRKKLADLQPMPAFKAIVVSGSANYVRIKQVKITGTRRARRWPRDFRWIDEGFHEHREVLADTPANMRKAQAYKRAEKALHRQQSAIYKAHKANWAAMGMKSAGEVLK